MPYIGEHARQGLRVVAACATTPGELNFQITALLVQYIRQEQLSYQLINDVMGALEGAKAEFYRRVAVPYEEQKLSDNGDVYPFWAAPRPLSEEIETA